MPLDDGQVPRIDVATRGVPVQERIPYWNEKCQVADIVSLSDRPFEAEAKLLLLPGLRVGWCQSETPAFWYRSSQRVCDGDDDFALLLPLDGPMMGSGRGRDVVVDPGDGVGILHADPFSVSFQARNRHLILMLPQAPLRPLVPNLEDAAGRLISRGSEALRLLRSYVAGFGNGAAVADPELWQKVTSHVYDLVALAIGARQDAEHLAKQRGVREARLKAIKDDFAANPLLTLSAIAAHQHVTPRYVQKLFEEDGTTFTTYALDQRLSRVHAMLTDKRYSRWPISAIAYHAGFGDLSHFNRDFRRRYGATPSDVRQTSG